jgi:hypothetical protein
MQRITKKDLEWTVQAINETAGTPQEPWAKDKDGKYQPQAHCYHLSGAYGRSALHKLCSEGSGIHDIFGGHMSKRELYGKMQAFLKGMNA